MAKWEIALMGAIDIEAKPAAVVRLVSRQGVPTR
jgi:hypothetical protein